MSQQHNHNQVGLILINISRPQDLRKTQFYNCILFHHNRELKPKMIRKTSSIFKYII